MSIESTHNVPRVEVESIEDMLRNTVPVQQVPVATPTVDRMLAVYDRQWTATAEQCLQRAAELEAAAADLRSRASDLNSARNYLEDVKQAVLFEIESRERAASLALVNPVQE